MKPTDNISRRFLLEELTVSEYAERHSIDNTPDDTAVKNLRELCVNCLDLLQDELDKEGKDLIVNSGFRCEKVNAGIGGSEKSQHRFGEAADLRVKGWTSQKLFDFIVEKGILFDQLIEEFGRWVHLSYRASRLRNQKLRAYKNPETKKTVYESV